MHVGRPPGVCQFHCEWRAALYAALKGSLRRPLAALDRSFHNIYVTTHAGTSAPVAADEFTYFID